MKNFILCAIVFISLLSCSNKKNLKDPRPDDQLEFISVVADYRQKIYNSGNPIVASEITKEAIRFLDQGRTASDWVGFVEKIYPNGDIKVSLYVILRSDDRVANVVFSGYDFKMTIDLEDVSRDIVKTIKVRDNVVFSAEILEERSITQSGAIKEPEFNAVCLKMSKLK